MARRLHINRSKGKIHGGIYATRLASHFNIQIHQHDYPLPKVYLDRQTMAHHQFIDRESTDITVPYNLVFSLDTRDIIPLPAPALFDPIARADTESCLRILSLIRTTKLQQRRNLRSGTLRYPLPSTST